MKHNLKITLIIISFFLVSQIIGLFVTSSYKDNFYNYQEKSGGINKIAPTNTTENITKNKSSSNSTSNIIKEKNFSIAKELIPEKVEIRNSIDFIQIVISFLVSLVIATLLFIILMKVGVIRVMRVWLFTVVVIGLFISFSLLFYYVLRESISIYNVSINLAEIIAFILAFTLAYYKIYKRDIVIHNLTELFIYPGVVMLFLPIINVYVALGLLLLISIYDVVAVFKTKQMQKMATFMIKDVRAFTGFLFPWIDKKDKLKLKKIKEKKKKIGKNVRVKINVAVLGGGDIALPMLFSNSVFLAFGLINALLIIFFATIGLTLLLIFGERDKAYPALPPLAMGCIIGYIVGLLI